MIKVIITVGGNVVVEYVVTELVSLIIDFDRATRITQSQTDGIGNNVLYIEFNYKSKNNRENYGNITLPFGHFAEKDQEVYLTDGHKNYYYKDIMENPEKFKAIITNKLMVETIDSVL
jgi:hypothetical protein